ncbi:hypothetical protein G6F58_012749 [Rhizopus delemar]|nr:hypothetical protein G6F58_012749 [Rhizopus delemar]
MDRIEGGMGCFLQEAKVHHARGMPIAIEQNFESLWDLVRYLPDIGRRHLFEKVYRRASTYFKTKKMRMAFQTMMSPYDAPAVYSLLQYTECVEGIWRGGFHQVVQRLEQIAQEKFGASFVYNAPVAKINTQGRRASRWQGVRSSRPWSAMRIYAYHRPVSGRHAPWPPSNSPAPPSRFTVPNAPCPRCPQPLSGRSLSSQF